jgi:Protein of unknown function (DUF1761)
MIILSAAVAGLVHFLIGGLWYSPLMFSKIWMQGLGLTDADIKEAPVNIWMALLASALASFAQAAALAWLFVTLAMPSIILAALVGAGAALAFGFMPMLRDRVWANRPWSVILVDAGYECVGGAGAGALIAWMLTMPSA